WSFWIQSSQTFSLALPCSSTELYVLTSIQTVQRSADVFLVGGRGKENGWIITFPENSHFNDVSEEVLAKVLTYLTSVPRQHESDTKFILILDRRLDTWTSVKMTLQRIAPSLQTNLSPAWISL
uniref:MCF2L n=1 Tax=Pelusios castaneus TaxID=367368 RepID=A0A8C8SPQ0_9SAUR